MHTGLPSVCFGLGAPRELGRGPSLPCDHHVKEGQWLFGFLPGPGAWADFFSAFAGEKVAVNVWWEGGWFPPDGGGEAI